MVGNLRSADSVSHSNGRLQFSVRRKRGKGENGNEQHTTFPRSFSSPFSFFPFFPSYTERPAARRLPSGEFFLLHGVAYAKRQDDSVECDRTGLVRRNPPRKPGRHAGHRTGRGLYAPPPAAGRSGRPLRRVKRYTDYHDLLADPEIDVVGISLRHAKQSAASASRWGRRVQTAASSMPGVQARVFEVGMSRTSPSPITLHRIVLSLRIGYTV